MVDLTQDDSPPPKSHTVMLLSPEALSPVLDTPPAKGDEEPNCPTRQLSWSTQDFSQPMNPVKSLFASQSQHSSPPTQPLTRTDSTGPSHWELSPSQQENSSQVSVSSLVPSQVTAFGPPISRAPRNEKNLSQKNKRDLEELSQSSEVYYTPANQAVKEKSDTERSIDLMNARIPPTKKTKTSLLAHATNMGEIPLSQEPAEIRPVSNNPFLLPWSETVRFLTEAKKLDEKSEKRREQASSVAQMSRSRFDLLFERLREIAGGSFGSVILCRKRVDGCLYAVKRTLRKIAVHESRTLREMFAGAALGQLEANPWLIRHQDAWVEDGHLFLQMEWGARGSLQAQLEARSEGKKAFPSDVLLEIALQVAQGLGFLHDHGFAHLDIKPANILECQEKHFKICDFGSMASVRDKPSHIDDGDTRYQPRESLEGEYSYETNLAKIDMFGLGATLYALARGEELPQGGPEFVTIRNGELCELSVEPILVRLIRALMHGDPEQRPTADDVIKALNKHKGESLEVRVKSMEEQIRGLQQVIEQQNQQINRLRGSN